MPIIWGLTERGRLEAQWQQLTKGNGYIAGVGGLQLGPNRCRGEAAHQEGRLHSRRVHGQNKGGEGYVSGDVSEGGPLRCHKPSFGESLPMPASSLYAASYFLLKIIYKQ